MTRWVAVLLFWMSLCGINLCFGDEIQAINAQISIDGSEKRVKHQVVLQPSQTQKNYRFSYPLLENAEIYPLLFSVKNRIYKVYLKNKRVFFEIADVYQGEKIHFSIYYKTLNHQKFLQIQRLYIPHFNNPFEAKIKVKVDRKWEIFSHNDFLKGQKYRWQGRVDKKSFEEVLWLSLREAKFDVKMDHYLYSQKPITRLNVVLPKYFKDSGLKVRKLDFYTTPLANIMQNTSNTTFAFRQEKAKDFKITLRAQISHTLSAIKYDWLDPKDFLQPHASLRPLAEKIIKQDPATPPYIAIAKWLYQNIQYNEKYVGFHMNSEQILRLKSGVCEHYTQSYMDLLRSLEIPVAFVTGMGFNPTKHTFEYHAWNLVYIDKKWIPIDVTWGLFDGILPVSHLFFYVGYQPLMMYETYEAPISSLHSQTKQEIEFVP